ncbi:copper amine oxidase N-terminal domain-containing protein [Paenibacillus sp. NPDC057934]|uniref:copper amine oxidase N-terminal domain-containing protein n=1 Tax=Paenibacillus sp. NPDC057934 TaxID=3346282 RepID=UPI0036D79EEC
MARKAGIQMLVFMLVSLWITGTVSAAPKLQVEVNNSSVAGVVTESGHTMVPLKAFERFGNLSMQWVAQTKKVTIKRDSTVIQLTVGDRTAYINDNPVQLEVAAKIVDGRVTVPLRFIAEALGARITVDAVANTVWIQERASAAILKNYNSSDLAASRIAALQIPVDGSTPSRLIEESTAGDPEVFSESYYFAKGKSDGYYLQNGHFVTYFEIKDNIRQAVWEASLDNTKEATNKDITSVFGHPIYKEYGKRPAQAEEYVYFYTSIWGSSVTYGVANVDGTSSELGRLMDWPDTRKQFVVAIPGETKR